MINRVILVGRLVRDPDLRYTPNGVAVSNFTIAANRPFTNEAGEREADFVNCVTWRKTAENLANYMTKGSIIGVDGRIQTRSYDNVEGKKVYVTEVVAETIQFLESKNNKPPASNDEQKNNESNQPDPQQEMLEPIDVPQDDLPF